MTYEEIFGKVKEALAKAKAEAVSGKLAIEFDITGEGEGKFYVEVKDGSVNVEPYDYVDNDAKFIADAQTLIKLAKGTIKPETAYAEGSLVIDGDVNKGLEFKALVESVPAPKKRRTKAEIEADKKAKAEAEKKPAVKAEKKIEAKAEKVEVKAEKAVAKAVDKVEAKVEAKPVAKAESTVKATEVKAESVAPAKKAEKKPAKKSK